MTSQNGSIPRAHLPDSASASLTYQLEISEPQIETGFERSPEEYNDQDIYRSIKPQEYSIYEGSVPARACAGRQLGIALMKNAVFPFDLDVKNVNATGQPQVPSHPIVSENGLYLAPLRNRHEGSPTGMPHANSTRQETMSRGVRGSQLLCRPMYYSSTNLPSTTRSSLHNQPFGHAEASYRHLHHQGFEGTTPPSFSLWSPVDGSSHQPSPSHTATAPAYPTLGRAVPELAEQASLSDAPYSHDSPHPFPNTGSAVAQVHTELCRLGCGKWFKGRAPADVKHNRKRHESGSCHLQKTRPPSFQCRGRRCEKKYKRDDTRREHERRHHHDEGLPPRSKTRCRRGSESN
ncbi:hypothetical protein B0J12DRAFT_61131 [Macrophomina phaseolina]|uniref:C2H2-type domain-containing protein n=1 Tax=Macrophomina phaseolina TaxID=35725 RepID=A0ABQ8GCE2_9PEZI|nr:hypothetical protein B0J12DRAFT_61131 [Macrophomina phaseolina]